MFHHRRCSGGVSSPQTLRFVTRGHLIPLVGPGRLTEARAAWPPAGVLFIEEASREVSRQPLTVRGLGHRFTGRVSYAGPLWGRPTTARGMSGLPPHCLQLARRRQEAPAADQVLSLLRGSLLGAWPRCPSVSDDAVPQPPGACVPPVCPMVHEVCSRSQGPEKLHGDQ